MFDKSIKLVENSYKRSTNTYSDGLSWLRLLCHGLPGEWYTWPLGF